MMELIVLGEVPGTAITLTFFQTMQISMVFCIALLIIIHKTHTGVTSIDKFFANLRLAIYFGPKVATLQARNAYRQTVSKIRQLRQAV
jgi:hypothetical protein